jgi:hypothetical protein
MEIVDRIESKQKRLKSPHEHTPPNVHWLNGIIPATYSAPGSTQSGHYYPQTNHFVSSSKSIHYFLACDDKAKGKQWTVVLSDFIYLHWGML